MSRVKNFLLKKSKAVFNSTKDNTPNSIDQVDSSDSSEQRNYIQTLEKENKKLKKKINSSVIEERTISFQLGKTIIDVVNKDLSGKELPNQLLKIYIESRKRKYKYLDNASLLDKLIIVFNDEKLLKEYRLVDGLKDISQPSRSSKYEEHSDGNITSKSNDTPKSDIHSRLLDNSKAHINIQTDSIESIKDITKKTVIKNIEGKTAEKETIRNQLNIPVNSLDDTYIESNIEGIELACIQATNEIKEIAQIQVTSQDRILELFATTVYKLSSNQKSRRAALLFSFIDEFGNEINEVPGIGVSALFGKHYKYLNSNSDNINLLGNQVLNISIPNNVKIIKISVAGIKLDNSDKISIRLKAKIYKKSKIKKQDKTIKSKKDLVSQILPKPIKNGRNIRYTSELKVACILDEFTAECLSHEVKLVKVAQENWERQLEEQQPDFLLVESCWRGNDGNWGTLTQGSGGGKKLSPIIKYCQKNGIPTVFWNKEDPPHYDKFGAIARLFDLAITTDINMVPHYKKDYGIDVYPLSFGAQPVIHNPVPMIPRLEKAVFAGSYYGDKPKRCYDFENVISAVERAGVDYDIFDRNYYRDIAKFAFPKRYQDKIVGNLSPDEVWKAHKGYKYQINMNSVQDSATMFARRVYESLASGTPVISNDSLGVRELFGDLVIMENDSHTIEERLKELESSPKLYQELARQGVRRVMREHTYGHRIEKICHLLGMDVEVALPTATLAVTVSSKADIKRAEKLFKSQTAPSKHLFIELNNFPSAHDFLNKSNNKTTFAMKFGHEFYQNDGGYYQNKLILKCNAKDTLYPEALEDFIYWGEI